MTKQEIEKILNRHDIEKIIDKIILNNEPLCRDMIIFAEYLERKHNRGFVVYYSKACHQFTVCNWDEWQEEQNRPWNGLSQWHTRKCFEDELTHTNQVV